MPDLFDSVPCSSLTSASRFLLAANSASSFLLSGYTISRMPDALLRDVVCENCSRRTPQRLSTLEPILWLQAASSETGIYINYACPLCNKLSRSRLGAGKCPQDAEAAKLLDELAVYIVFLKCANVDCESPVILLAPVKNGMHDPDLMAHIRKNWSNHGAACAKGHRPAYPYEARVWKPLESEL